MTGGRSNVGVCGAALALLLAACSSAGPPSSASPTDGAADLAVVDLQQPPDLRLPGDSLPRGAVSFFNQKRCPSGWAPLTDAAGRTLVPTVGSDPPAEKQGTPLDDSEDRAHGHQIDATLQPPSVHYAGIAGEANHGVASAASAPLAIKVSAASAGLPYVQLLACQKAADADPAQKAAPSGMLLFFTGSDCPTGWLQAGLSQGRFLVGLPDSGTPGQTFGGKPLSAQEIRQHTHTLSGHLDTTSHGIELASSGAAGGYAKHDSYPYSETSKPESAALPYLKLLQCQKM